MHAELVNKECARAPLCSACRVKQLPVQILAGEADFGPSWALLFFWARLGPFGPFWAFLGRFGPFGPFRVFLGFLLETFGKCALLASTPLDSPRYSLKHFLMWDN